MEGGREGEEHSDLTNFRMGTAPHPSLPVEGGLPSSHYVGFPAVPVVMGIIGSPPGGGRELLPGPTCG